MKTGGAIRKLLPSLSKDVLLTINADSLFSPEIVFADFVQAHFSETKEPFSTMMLRKTPAAESFGAIRLGPDGWVQQFLETRTVDFQEPESTKKTLFTGIQLLGGKALSEIEREPEVFSITRDFLEPKSVSNRIKGVLTESQWFDVGTPERLQRAEHFLADKYLYPGD